MPFGDLYDPRVPQPIRDLALERIRTKRSLGTRTDIEEGLRIEALLAIHSALPDYELKRGEKALVSGISASTGRRRQQ